MGPLRLGLSSPVVALVDAVAEASVEDLLAVMQTLSLFLLDGTTHTTITSARAVLSALFVSPDAPQFALVLAGPRVRWVAERDTCGPRGAFGS